MPDGARVELEAISVNPPVFVEVWAHQGPPRSAQTRGHATSAETTIPLGHHSGATPSRLRSELPEASDHWLAQSARQRETSVSTARGTVSDLTTNSLHAGKPALSSH